MARKNRSERRKANRERRELDAALKAVTEFYIEVAETLDLPHKPLPAAPPPPPKPTREEALRAMRAKEALAGYKQWFLPTVAVLLLVGMAAYRWWPSNKAAVPEGFRGTWVTGNASYAGRMIVISLETIEIVAGQRAATGALAVTSSTVDSTAAGVRLKVVYGKAGSEQSLEMMLHPGPRPTLTLVRPADVVWERLEGKPPEPPGGSRTPDA